MDTSHQSLSAVQNLGWLDRIVRFVVGSTLIAIVLMELRQGSTLGWQAILPIIAIYPLLSSILGWDPLYATGHIKSCDTSPHNKCGTYLFEIESAMGKDVACNDGYDCSLTGNEKSHEH